MSREGRNAAPRLSSAPPYSRFHAIVRAMLRNTVERIQNRFNIALTSATDWALAAAILVAAAIVAVVLHTALLWLARRVMGERESFLRTVMTATQGPTRLGLLLIALAIALPLTPLPGKTAKVLSRVLTLATICLIGWVALTASISAP